MKIYYHAVPGGNFGDDLNLLMWPLLFPGLLDGVVANASAEQMQAVTEYDHLLIGIGTLLNHRIPSPGRKIVFGAGAGYGESPRLDRQWDIRFVRGPRTAQALGLRREKAITDPAILLRRLEWKTVGLRHPCALMLHHSNTHSQLWQEIAADLGIRLIDSRRNPAEVVSEIGASGLLITESLHGAIVADALRVPWIPLASDYAVLKWKWHDWCDTVGLTYHPVKIPMMWEGESGMKRRLKFHLARRTIRRSMAATLSQLSRDSVIESLTERLVAEVEALKSALEQHRPDQCRPMLI